VNISVEDLGPGIPPEDIPLLFGQFVRLKRDLAGAVRGTGLGLYVCKNLVEAMEGHIWVESPGIPGQGSSFGFTLPCVLPQ
jgi:signal transduction histidine kinase